MTKIGGSESGSISQRHGSADLDPDPHQNVMDPQHCKIGSNARYCKVGKNVVGGLIFLNLVISINSENLCTRLYV